MRLMLPVALGVGLVVSAGAAMQSPATPAPPPAKAAPQAPAAPQTPKAAPQRRATPRAATPSTVIVRDISGSPIADVKIAVSGASSQRATTGPDGKATLGMLTDGEYRVRFEREGFVMLEHDVTVRTRPAQLEIVLSSAPPPPEPPAPPPPPPAPAPPPAPSSVASAPTGPATFVSIPQFLDKNYIGRDPLKESVLGCLTDSTTRILQMKEAVSEHTHADLDEIVYVVAGEGTVRVRDQTAPLAAGTLTIIPHGQPHGFFPRGKNPLMVLSMLSGAPCRAATQAASSKGGSGK
jgi:hypothetical protein